MNLPPLKPSDHPESRIMQWSKLEMKAIQDYARQAVREAIATAVPEWSPIETAPKDVTVLLCGAKRLEMCVGMNHSRDGWVTDTTSGWVSMYPPTHWMPLPPPPEVKP